MVPKPSKKSKPKLTDAERHKRFVAMAHEVEADERPEAFDRAFKKVIRAKPVRGKGMRPGT
jgi:hypothetical protein